MNWMSIDFLLNNSCDCHCILLGSGSSSISSGSSTSATTNAPPIATVTGAPRNVRDALNMLHQTKQDTASNSTFVANHYQSSGRTAENDTSNGTGGSIPSNKKYSGVGNSSEYSQGASSTK